MTEEQLDSFRLHTRNESMNSTYYKINPDKLKGAPREVIPYILSYFEFSEEFEYFDKIKPYLDIPEKPKTLEEILQEFDENIDELIERTKRNFYDCKATAERKYENKFDQIFNNFEYAKENGRFLSSLSTGFLYLGNNLEYTTTFSAKSGVGFGVGFYSVDNGNLIIYIKEKPTAVVRFFMNKLLGMRWVDN